MISRKILIGLFSLIISFTAHAAHDKEVYLMLNESDVRGLFALDRIIHTTKNTLDDNAVYKGGKSTVKELLHEVVKLEIGTRDNALLFAALTFIGNLIPLGCAWATLSWYNRHMSSTGNPLTLNPMRDSFIALGSFLFFKKLLLELIEGTTPNDPARASQITRLKEAIEAVAQKTFKLSPQEMIDEQERLSRATEQKKTLVKKLAQACLPQIRSLLGYEEIVDVECYEKIPPYYQLEKRISSSFSAAEQKNLKYLVIKVKIQGTNGTFPLSFYFNEASQTDSDKLRFCYIN